ncbi:hypothetical protein FRC01_003674 [Tulasnella sp. 417]|nr:hypothetical protein FRC01_003674 [Tulasnella sp. 417]
MQYIPGSSVTLSATLSYLQRNQPLPDDSEVQTHIPQICVDYLSHEWQEEDVWKSWRNMTRHKSEITNGVRLENASWRTWWKQRNKLKTVSPETLNWLKDSDVTWLYGPLHTAAEPVPPPKQSTAEERLNLVKATGKKPILKHRTITELLNLHAHEHGHAVVAGSPTLETVGMDFGSPTENGSRANSPRPNLPHTKSDSQIVRIASASGKDSPPGATLIEPNGGDPSASRSLSPVGSEGLPASVSTLSLNAAPAKRHISFNTFVEQYISIEDPSAPKPRTPAQRRAAFYDSDDDIAYDDEDDDEESSASSILEMHPGQVVGSRRPDQRGTTPMLRSNSTSQERERMTIAPIPPTVLKAAEELPAPSPQVVYAPPKEFLWDQGDFASSASSSGESSGSSDNLSTASGSITGQNADMGFVAPQWGRPPIAPGTVGKGSSGPVGPAGVFQSDPYAATGYEEPAKPDATQPASATGTSTTTPAPGPQHIGLLAGRTKWVPGSEIPDDEDEAEEDSGDEAAENSTTGDEDDEDETPVRRDLGTTNASSSVSGSTTSSSANRTVIAGSPQVVVGSPPSTVRSTSSRGSSSQQPARGILKKNAGSVGGSVNGGDDSNSSSGVH